jgi:hypothetical protein
MTPKEKAKKLVIKMFEPNNHILNMNFKVDYDIAKQCALACVDEIKQSSKIMPYTVTFEKYDDADELTASVRAEIESFNMYWNEVKQEIYKL